MKTKTIFASLLMGLAVVACNNNASTVNSDPSLKTAKDYVPTKAQKDSVSYLLGIQFGSFIKGYNFGDVNYSEVLNGMKAFINAKGNMRDADFTKQFKVDPNKMNDIFNSYLEMQQTHLTLANKEKEEKYLADNLKKAGVNATATGLQYIIEEKGNENVPGPMDTVWVKYKGTLIDGTVFDETKEGTDPINFTLGQVIPGWSEGLQLIGEGGKVKLFIPSELGYGEQGSQGIEPNSTLLFDVELVKVGKYVAPEAE